MAQHDYIIANQSGAAFRADLNNGLAAIVSQNSGASEPSTTYAYQWWADTTTGLLKIRNAANNAWITLFQLDGEWSTLAVENGTAAAPSIYFKDSGTDTGFYSPGADQVAVATNGTQRLTVDTAATTSTLPVAHPLGAVGTPSITFTGDLNTGIWSPAADTIAFSEGGVEAMRIDSSGRLLVGTSTARSNYYNTSFSSLLQIEGAASNSARSFSFTYGNSDDSSGILILAKHRSTSVGGNTVVQNGDHLGWLSFQGSDGTEFVEGAYIRGEVDGTPGANDMPGRLVFSTTVDGASSPTERMRITSGGDIRMANVNGIDVGSASDIGVVVEATGTQIVYRAGNAPLYVGRQTDEGTLISLRQAGIEEGTISVSGTTVSYNGAHLSRWSQLPSGAERTEILRGSVLSNIDEMCEWGNEDNEQLNRMKVSDVEGDKNVSGVFQAWDDDDDTYTDDFYCAMTGDFIIRIAEGITVERGDLLMSAGDGTAKPQDDDIIRSKTIAKVTSTNVSCTYADGSYCVPCVLMAC